MKKKEMEGNNLKKNAESTDLEKKNVNELSMDEKLTILLERTAKIDKIDGTVSAIDTRLSSLEKDSETLKQKLDDEIKQRALLETKVEDVKQKSSDLEQSCTFLSGKYDDILKENQSSETVSKTNSVKINQLEKENVELKHKLDILRNDLEQSNIARNIEQQYHRTSINIKLCGVPQQRGEDESNGPSNPVTKEVIELVCKTAGITLMKNSIDVCHRLGSDEKSPIIIRFTTKSARFEFVNQGQHLKGISYHDIDFSELKANKRGDTSKRGRVGGNKYKTRSMDGTRNVTDDLDPTSKSSSIYLQEHLTKFNKTLLQETKAALKGLYEYPGYVKNGEIRAKITANEKFVTIHSKSDYEKLLQK